MRSIQLLDQHTINKIAAGEVVERPSSVVKELVENAIDAKSSAITVEIKDGGIAYIRISDNGIGIPKEQVRTAFLRHSTSKIKDEVDLQTIGTLGFRGEALASIAAVAQVEMMTKTRDTLTGIRLVIEGGKVIIEEEIGCPEGTTLIIRNLFYNTPARRKFLKRPGTEGSYISDLMNRVALGHPEISFKYMNKSKVALHTSGNNNLKNAIFNVYGKNLVKDLMEVEGTSEHFNLKGFVGKPAICRGNRTFESYYINGRYIKSKIVEKALHDAYKDFIPPNNYPVVVLHFTIDPKQVDVNVHPTKMEVRFQEEDQIYDLVKNTINQKLINDNIIPEIKLHKEKFIAKEEVKEYVPEAFEIKNKKLEEESSKVREVEEKSLKQVSHVNQVEPNNIQQKTETSAMISGTTVPKTELVQEKHQVESNESKELKITEDSNEHNSSLLNNPVNDQIKEEPKVEESTQLDMDLNSLQKQLDDFKIVGQVFNTYWLIEKDQKMFIVDQHAAHEKVLYERIKASRHHENNTQILLKPIVVNLQEAESLLIKAHLKIFKQFGFEIEDFGNNAYIIRGVPYIFNTVLDNKVFTDMLDGLIEEERQIEDDMLAEKIALMSCKAAVKGNNRMSLPEVKSLMSQLFTLENPYNCPHGRPTIISMTKYELEKKFKRV
ncbi:DNA mismatch repair endonuclease MutL [Vallitalea okinawensis]|uniref:DNA mismatch repair endonuclease MutL n=1 Tax=Vallitalea okinawensis TaxID=2078660 RepID=UPI000CFDB33A|nr:DNA mismatch repair endonuclease MutL [Vallitalea okinawensis]